jgi:hypothetical protein
MVPSLEFLLSDAGQGLNAHAEDEFLTLPEVAHLLKVTSARAEQRARIKQRE